MAVFGFRRSVAWTTLMTALMFGPGCDRGSDTEPRSLPSLAVGLSGGEKGKTTQAAAELEAAAEEPEPEPEPELVIEVLEVETEAQAPVSGREVAVAALELGKAALEWESRGTIPGKYEFVRIAEGLALVGEGGLRSVTQEELSGPVVVSSLPKAQLMGRWPEDVWYATQTPVAESEEEGEGERASFEYALFHLDLEQGWVPQPFRNHETWVGPDAAVRSGAREGLVVLEEARTWRVGSRQELDKVGKRMGKQVLDVIESRDGVVHNISLRPNGVYVQRSCDDSECVDQNARRLPYGSEWSFGRHVTHGKDGFSVLAKVEIEGMSIEHLLHYAGEQWGLESIVDEPHGLWGTPSGGLWMQVRSELWYRSPARQWYAVSVPEGSGHLSVGWDATQDEVWLARSTEEQTELFALPAIVAALE